jgi:hypothetical protein
MAHIVLADAQTWLENTKAHLTTLDANLEAQVSTMVMGRLAETFNASLVSTWTDNNTTPALVKQIIAMMYCGWFYDRQFSEMVAAEGTSYGVVLRTYAEALLEGVITGSIDLIEVAPGEPETAPVFYPTDSSSTAAVLAANTNPDDQSLGPPKFGMSMIF